MLQFFRCANSVPKPAENCGIKIALQVNCDKPLRQNGACFSQNFARGNNPIALADWSSESYKSPPEMLGSLTARPKTVACADFPGRWIPPGGFWNRLLALDKPCSPSFRLFAHKGMMIEQSPSSILRLRLWRWMALLGLVAGTAGMLNLGTLLVAGQGSVEPTQNQGRRLSLAEQLRYGLRASVKSDKQFINHVVALVQQGKLPKKLVDSTFLWARQRAARKSRSRELRPMIYFKPALVLRAKRIGVKL